MSIAEIFPNDVRTKGQSLGAGTHWGVRGPTPIGLRAPELRERGGDLKDVIREGEARLGRAPVQ